MNALTLSFVARALGLPCPDEDQPLNGVVIDSRRVGRGDLFVAIPGPRFDGHDFVDQAREAGAAAVLVSRPGDYRLPSLVVDDTRRALGRLGAAWRGTFSGPVVGVTGSNGKTTVKEMTARLLAPLGPVWATQGNLNNDLGVPLTLLSLRTDHRAAVIEMGANHAGEIAYLSSLARPRVGVVTHAGPAHLEGFGSLEGVARAKGELFAALGEGEVAVINRDDRFAPLWDELAAPAQVVDFGLDPRAAVRAEAVKAGPEGSRFRLITPVGETWLTLPLPGEHNVRNALAATAVALSLGVELGSIRAALESMVPVAGRLRPRQGRRGARLIDDSYNANPASLQAGLAVLAAHSGRRTLVLGDMAELGEEAVALHRQAGETARTMGIDRLYAVGSLAAEAAQSFGAQGRCFDTVEGLVQALLDDLDKEDTVLVKGSRSAGMERVVAALTPQRGEG